MGSISRAYPTTTSQGCPYGSVISMETTPIASCLAPHGSIDGDESALVDATPKSGGVQEAVRPLFDPPGVVFI